MNFGPPVHMHNISFEVAARLGLDAEAGDWDPGWDFV